MLYDTAHMSACIVLLCTADIMGGAGQFVYLYVTIEMYLSHLKLYGWYEQYGKCSYIISGF